MSTDPFAIDSAKFDALLASVADCTDDCTCVPCTFIDHTPVVLHAEGVEPTPGWNR